MLQTEVNKNSLLPRSQGAAALLEDKTILTAAAQILAVEAYHAGTIRTILYQNQGQQAFTSPKLLVRDVVQAISNLRDSVDGAADIDQGVVTFVPPFFYVANIVPADENALVYLRNTSQV
jgi:Ferritin-like domain